MIRGIMLSKSLNLSSMARSLEIDSNSSVSARHIFKRLDRNLGLFDTDSVKEKMQSKQIAMIDEGTLIYFDPTDIIKKYGKKFEALSWVFDGSDDHKTKKGYPVISCVALKKDELIPLDYSV